MGAKCALFEKDFSAWQKRKHSILVNSGSSANLALIQALLNLGRLQKGDRVGFSALTWATNVMPLIQLGLVPVPIDIEIKSLNVSLAKLRGADIKALFITNLLGGCDDLDQIALYCEAERIILLEDNCESLGSVYHGVRLGNYGLASTFSFYVGHHLSTIEGGMVCTNDDELADMLKMVRAHGWRRDTDNYDMSFYGRYTFYDLGYNLRPTEITGLLGIIQLPFLNEIVQKREENMDFMVECYDSPDVYYYKHKDYNHFSSFCFPFVCKTPEKKDEILWRLEGNVEARPIVGGNITQQPFFKKYIGEHNCPNAALVHQNGFYIGNNPDLTREELQLMKDTLCLK